MFIISVSHFKAPQVISAIICEFNQSIILTLEPRTLRMLRVNVFNLSSLSEDLA